MSSTQSENIFDVFGQVIYEGDEVVFSMSVFNKKKSIFYRGVVVEVRKKIKVRITDSQPGSEYSNGQEVWAYNYRLVVV